MTSIRLLITDLDNTIYDWVGYYVPSFLAMVHELSLLTDIPEERLKESFKRVHEAHRTTEYSFAIQELDVLAELNEGLSALEVLEKYHPAIRAFRHMRKKLLHLYPGVVETLSELRSAGLQIAAHTDSLMFHSIARLKQLGVEHLYDAIFAPPDHALPEGFSLADVRYHSDASRYETTIPLRVELSPTMRKPDSRSLAIVLAEFRVRRGHALYVGDSLTADIVMAQRTGVRSVLAEYGRHIETGNKEELLKITYWTDERHAEDQSLSAATIEPNFRIGNFRELLDVVTNQ